MPQNIGGYFKLRQLLGFLKPFSQLQPKVLLDFILETDFFDNSLNLLFGFFFRQHQFKQYQMKAKWITFLLTFLSYGLLHAVRRSLSSLKYALNSPPYTFSPLFLGVLDMLVLISLATSLVVLGPKIINHGPIKLLDFSMICLSIVLGVLGFILIVDITTGFPYIVVYLLVGLCLCVGWPSCIYVLSLQFQKGIAFSLWFGCTQFGDFVAVLLNLIFIQALDANAGFFIFAIIIFVLVAFVLNRKYLLKYAIQSEPPRSQLAQQSPAQGYVQDLVEQKEVQAPSNQRMEQHKTQPQENFSRINFLTVWSLPGVAGYILSFVFVKSVNVMIGSWLVFYLNMIGMVKQSNIIVLLWSISTFAGGILGVYLNSRFTKKYFIVALLIAGVLFIFLEQMHLYYHETQVIILVLSCGITFGGPYTLMNTSIPLYLSQKPHIKNHPDAKAAIISAMEGYSLLFCGISLIVIPAIGVVDLHWFAFVYCSTAALILLRQEYLDQKERLENQALAKKKTRETKVRPEKDIDRELSANLQGASYGKKQRKRRRSMRSDKSLERQRNFDKQLQIQPEHKESKSDVDGRVYQQKMSFPPFLSREKVQDINVLEGGQSEKIAEAGKQAEVKLSQPFLSPINTEPHVQLKEISENTDYLTMP